MLIYLCACETTTLIDTTTATCIPTHDGTCISAEDFSTETESRAEEYREYASFPQQWGLGHVNAHYAYSHLSQIKGEEAAPGTGVTIGFIDSGIDLYHPYFDGKTITEIHLNNVADETGDVFSHGTAVASVAAAIRSSENYEIHAHGLAWGADIAMYAIPLDSNENSKRGLSYEYSPISTAGLAYWDSLDAATFSHVLTPEAGLPVVDLLNNSWGYSGIIDNYSEQELRNSYGQTIEILSQENTDEKIILIWSAGNAHGEACVLGTANCVNGTIDAVSTEVLPGLVARIEELQGHSIAVVALAPDGEIANYSNHCGITADFCIAAPGSNVLVAYFGPINGSPGRAEHYSSGTSVAAPFVAGGLAIMKQLFRDQLSNTELVTRLFETANDTDFYSDPTIYGHGSMDLQTATWPVGVLDVPIGSNNTTGSDIPLYGTRLTTSVALGDGLNRSLDGTEFVALDDLDAPFWFDLGSFTTEAVPRPTTSNEAGFRAPMLEWANPAQDVNLQIGYHDSLAHDRDSHLVLADDALTLTLAGRNALTGTFFTTEGVSQRLPVSGVTITWHPAESSLNLHAGWVRERKSLLGTTAKGAFGDLSADSTFLGVDTDAELGGWHVGAEVEIGAVYSAPRDGIFTKITPLTTTAFTLHASTSLDHNGAFRLSVSQPLRVERGQAVLDLPAGRTQTGEVVRHTLTADLTPSGRQIEVAMQWQQPLSIGEASIGAVLTHQPGHLTTAEPEFTFLSGWRWVY